MKKNQTINPVLADHLNTLLLDILLFNLSNNQDLQPQIQQEIQQIRTGVRSADQRTNMVVEDKPSNRQLLVELLKPVGFEVRQAENGIDIMSVQRTVIATEGKQSQNLAIASFHPMANATPYGYRVRQSPLSGNPPAALVSLRSTRGGHIKGDLPDII